MAEDTHIQRTDKEPLIVQCKNCLGIPPYCRACNFTGTRRTKKYIKLLNQMADSYEPIYDTCPTCGREGQQMVTGQDGVHKHQCGDCAQKIVAARRRESINRNRAAMGKDPI